MRYVVGDVHGNRDLLHDSLREVGLIDDEADWAGGEAELWFVGDFFDRGPDGVGVVDDVMRWQRQAAGTGGSVQSVLGNHEVLALGTHRFGDEIAPDEYGAATDITRSFAIMWFVNGGQLRDQQQLRADQIAWLSDLPPLARSGDDLLMHSDTLAYQDYGDTVEAVNAAVHEVLHSGDVTSSLMCWERMTTRFDFLPEEGARNADLMLEMFGGSRIVHGHSPIGHLTDTPSEDVTGPWSYAEGRALAVDGGGYDGGPLLVVPLDT